MTPINYGVAIVRPATLEDAHNLAPRLRPADLQEIAAGSGEAPVVALCRGVADSSVCYAIVSPSDPQAVFGLFGVTPLQGAVGVGAVWLLGSPDLTRISVKFLRHSHEWLARLFEGYQLLGNLVDARNTVHIRWLKWLGFRFVCLRPAFGKGGETFIEFCKLKPI